MTAPVNHPAITSSSPFLIYHLMIEVLSQNSAHNCCQYLLHWWLSLPGYKEKHKKLKVSLLNKLLFKTICVNGKRLLIEKGNSDIIKQTSVTVNMFKLIKLMDYGCWHCRSVPINQYVEFEHLFKLLKSVSTSQKSFFTLLLPVIVAHHWKMFSSS